MKQLTHAAPIAEECSPFLKRLLAMHPDIAQANPEEALDAVMTAVERAPAADTPSLMKLLRVQKGRLALLAALADIGGAWPLARVTGALSDFADACLKRAVAHLLQAAAKRGEITLPADGNTGVIVLGMGKLGAHELNYSSDIDLIVFYEPERLNYKGRQHEQHFMSRLAQDLVQIMQERTADGYVFRTDLRLRPDPASTPPAVSTGAAMAYYEAVGQNWERAAMIKARPVAGDIAAGEAFLKQLTPFMWRKYLDFASIQDIHSIKRQMDARRGGSIGAPGHNVKLGLGGIREIEFFVQIHQLIWGGKKPQLRTRSTCETLELLAREGHVTAEARDALLSAYAYLRTLEHRLQMVEDQQTHELPRTQEGIARIAAFMGEASQEAFSANLTAHLNAVHGIFSAAFRSSETLSEEGNLVFTGVSHDPDTLTTLRAMGYRQPEAISEKVMGWHHGTHRCTRTKRARELLTELMPALLKSFSETADPDAAFVHFDQFLSRIPAGVQLFSLFANNPHLLKLIANIMGSAPPLAESLAKHPDLLDGVLMGGFYGSLPEAENMSVQLDAVLAGAGDFEEKMEALRRFRNEKQFQAGMQMLEGLLAADACGAFLSTLAELCLRRALALAEEAFAASYGRIPGARFCILGLGRLGSGEMTFASDLDLVFVYDVPDFEIPSDGEKSYTAGVYYNRLTQRIHTALTTLGQEGRLYEVDTRLRPSGAQGLSAVSVKAFTHYFDELAWTFELMALTRARPVAGDDSLMAEMRERIHGILTRKRAGEQLRADVASMRARVAQEFAPKSAWDIKYARGGLMDMDFIAQYLLLKHAHEMSSLRTQRRVRRSLGEGGSNPAHNVKGKTGLLRPDGLAMTENYLPRDTRNVLETLASYGFLEPEAARALIPAYHVLTQTLCMLRLTSPAGVFDPESVQAGLKRLLARALEAEEFAQAEARLAQLEKEAYAYYLSIVEPA